jgi:hypothetical protein
MAAPDPLPYCVPHRRELSAEERSLLRHLLEREAPDRLGEIEQLKVVGRCGCGRCPTVLFGPDLDSPPLPSRPFREIANHIGRNADGVLVGVAVLEREGRIQELEAWSPWGEPITCWPDPSSLTPADGGAGLG